jgi:hypothetical protein
MFFATRKKQMETQEPMFLVKQSDWIAMVTRLVELEVAREVELQVTQALLNFNEKELSQ